MLSFKSALPAAFLAVACLCTGTSHAVEMTRSFAQNATGTCQAALPSYEGQIRKRPLAIQNEGTANAFVSCSLVGTHYGPNGDGREMTSVFVGLVNNTVAAIDVTCTLSDGLANLIAPAFIAKTVSVPANGWVELNWTSVDNGGDPFLFSANVQCNLPVGTGISYTVSLYQEDIGT